MDLTEVWPLFGLEIETPRLLLRPVRDEDLPGLAEAALAGIHDPGPTPFSVAWDDADPADLPRNLATYHWSIRGRARPEDWVMPFAIHLDGRVVGIQDLTAWDFPNRRTVNSGSWLTRTAQGRGLGTEMRAAILLFAFDTLGAEWAESGAAAWNEASLGVSRKLGYSLNGVTRVAPRPGEAVDEQRLRMSRTDFVRPTWDVTVRGADAVLAQLGISSRG